MAVRIALAWRRETGTVVLSRKVKVKFGDKERDHPLIIAWDIQRPREAWRKEFLGSFRRTARRVERRIPLPFAKCRKT